MDHTSGVISKTPSFNSRSQRLSFRISSRSFIVLTISPLGLWYILSSFQIWFRNMTHTEWEVWIKARGMNQTLFFHLLISNCCSTTWGKNHPFCTKLPCIFVTNQWSIYSWICLRILPSPPWVRKNWKLWTIHKPWNFFLWVCLDLQPGRELHDNRSRSSHTWPTHLARTQPRANSREDLLGSLVRKWMGN